eukprot:EG_transcript_16181
MAFEGQSLDLYAVLGVDRTARPNDIRKAYKRLAMEYHPDKNPAGADRFKEICDAYRILNDPEQRAIYDSGPKRWSVRELQKELARELDGRDLRDWVSDLVRSEQEAQSQRVAFERRRQEEMRRRAEFDALHGTPSPPPPPDDGPRRRWRSDEPTATAAPSARPPPKSSSAGSSPEPASPPASGQTEPFRLKQQFLWEFRQRRGSASAAHPGALPAVHPKRGPPASTSLRSNLSGASDTILSEALRGYPRFTNGPPMRSSADLD